MPLIPLAQITANPNQPRKAFPEDHIKQLAASIKARGLIQPITVRRVNDNAFQIVAGECRFRAHQLLGAEAIRAEVVDIDAKEMQLQAIIENLQRHDMNPIEEANAFKSLLDQGYDANAIMRELGLKSTALVFQRTRLLELAPHIQRLVASGQLPVAMAWAVSHVSERRQDELLKAISSGKLRTSDQAKAAAFALRDAELQIDAFGDLQQASDVEAAVLSRLERKIKLVAELVVAGFKDGECVAAQRVNPQRLATMADQLVLVRKHVLQMEHDLRRVATQSEIMQTIRSDSENPKHQTAVGVADLQRPQGRRKQNVADKVSRPRSRSRVG